MKKKLFIVGLLFLTLLNIVLLFTTNNLRNRLRVVHKQSFQWGFEQKGSVQAHLVYPGVKPNSAGLSLQVFLTDKGCQSCLANEVRNLNRLIKLYGSQVSVYFMGSDKTYLEPFYIQFPIKTIDAAKKILDNDFRFFNPVAMLVDKNNMVQLIHIAKTGNPAKTNKFYKKMTSLFKSLE